MTQNLISLTFSAEDLAAIHAAVRTLEEKLASLIELSVDERRRLNKMGDKTEAACRQTLDRAGAESAAFAAGFRPTRSRTRPRHA
jgi:hypothetical protein